MALDRFGPVRSASIAATRALSVHALCSAISRKPDQNGSSRVTLVWWPSITTDRLIFAHRIEPLPHAAKRLYRARCGEKIAAAGEYRGRFDGVGTIGGLGDARWITRVSADGFRGQTVPVFGARSAVPKSGRVRPGARLWACSVWSREVSFGLQDRAPDA